MEATHQVLDLVYLPDEGQECFEGSEQECYDFIQQQGGATFMYKIVPIVRNKTIMKKKHELESTLVNLKEFRESLFDFTAPENLGGWSLSNLPAHFWETLGECINDIEQYIKT